MRDLSIIAGEEYKSKDTNTDVVLRLLQDSYTFIPESLDKVFVKLKGLNHGVTLDKVINLRTDDDNDIIVSSKVLNKLVPDTYEIEVWVKANPEDDQDWYIFPNGDDPTIKVNTNIEQVNINNGSDKSSEIAVFTLADFVKQYQEAIAGGYINPGFAGFGEVETHTLPAGEPANVITTVDDQTGKINLTFDIPESKGSSDPKAPVLKGVEINTIASGEQPSGSFKQQVDGSYQLELSLPKTDSDSKQPSYQVPSMSVSVVGLPSNEQPQANFVKTDTGYLLNLSIPRGPKGDTGLDGKSAYEIAVSNGFKGTELQWLQSLKATNVRHAPTGYTLDRTTIPWTIWFDNGSGIQFPDYGTTATVYGYNQAINEYSNGWIQWPLISGILSASHGTLTLDTLTKVNGNADYWGVAKVINPINSDADSYDWSNVYFNDNSRSNSSDFRSNRQKNFLKACYELGIFSVEDLKPFGLVKR